VDDLGGGLGLELALLGLTRNGDHGERHFGTVVGEPCGEAAGTDLDVVGMCAEQQYATTTFFEDAIHAALRSAVGCVRSNRMSRLAGPQLRTRSRKPRWLAKPASM